MTSAEEADNGLITEPGLYDITAEAYHSDPVADGSLSSTGARKLLTMCPAAFRHWQLHGSEHQQVFDFGRAAHAVVLGVGDPLCVIDAEDYRTKAARTQRDNAYAMGQTPVLPQEHRQIMAMAKAIRNNETAMALLDRDSGYPEQTLVWTDPKSQVVCRAMLDWLPQPVEDQRLVVVDYKTTASANPEEIAKSVYKYGYHQQADFYLRGIRELGVDGGIPGAFVFLFQEKFPPYLITPVQLDQSAMEWGRIANDKALDKYRECTTTGNWPGYASDIISVSLPGYATRQYENAYDMGAFDLVGANS